MSLSVKLNQLANNLRKKYNVTDRLTIQDMINLTSSKDIFLISKGNFTIPVAMKTDNKNLVMMGATINNSQSSWGQIGTLSMPVSKAMGILSDTKNYVVKLHLFVTELTNTGICWIKWDANNNRTEFTPQIGDNVVILPDLGNEDAFSLMLHPFFDSMTIDLSKSYIIAESSN